MATYLVEMSEECGGSETAEITARTRSAAATRAESIVTDWVRGGDYGHDGASVAAWYTVLTPGGTVVQERTRLTVEVEPDHAHLIAAGLLGLPSSRAEACCGDLDPDDHNWTSEGEGGCRENPGVWSLGGTTLAFNDHCRACGLHRHVVKLGPQRNPDDHDTVEYSMPRTWCAECEAETCTCE